MRRNSVLASVVASIAVIAAGGCTDVASGEDIPS